MSEYEIKLIAKEELPPVRIGAYDKVIADLKKKEKGIYEVSIKERGSPIL